MVGEKLEMWSAEYMDEYSTSERLVAQHVTVRLLSGNEAVRGRMSSSALIEINNPKKDEKSSAIPGLKERYIGAMAASTHRLLRLLSCLEYSQSVCLLPWSHLIPNHGPKRMLIVPQLAQDIP
jgi:hypothetical protein